MEGKKSDKLTFWVFLCKKAKNSHLVKPPPLPQVPVLHLQYSLVLQKACRFFSAFYAIIPWAHHPHQFSRHPFIIIIWEYKHLILANIFQHSLYWIPWQAKKRRMGNSVRRSTKNSADKFTHLLMLWYQERITLSKLSWWVQEYHLA